jgi:hypothetical protein
MKRFAILFLCLTLISLSCKRHLNHEETETALKSAMQKFLSSQPNIDSSKVKFTVLGVEYFEDKMAYDCEFKIKMNLPTHDTVGIMGVRVSKDFSTVKRRY